MFSLPECLSTPLVYRPTCLNPVPKLAGAIYAMVCFGMTIRAKRNKVSWSIITVVTIYVMNVWLNVDSAIGVLTFVMCPLKYMVSQV